VFIISQKILLKLRWISNTNWKQNVKTLLLNKRQFFQFVDRNTDASKMPLFVETFTLKKLAPRVAPESVSKKSTNSNNQNILNTNNLFKI